MKLSSWSKQNLSQFPSSFYHDQNKVWCILTHPVVINKHEWPVLQKAGTKMLGGKSASGLWKRCFATDCSFSLLFTAWNRHLMPELVFHLRAKLQPFFSGVVRGWKADHLICPLRSYSAWQVRTWFGMCFQSEKRTGTTQAGSKTKNSAPSTQPGTTQTSKSGVKLHWVKRKHNSEHDTEQLTEDQVRLMCHLHTPNDIKIVWKFLNLCLDLRLRTVSVEELVKLIWTGWKQTFSPFLHTTGKCSTRTFQD